MGNVARVGAGLVVLSVAICAQGETAPKTAVAFTDVQPLLDRLRQDLPPQLAGSSVGGAVGDRRALAWPAAFGQRTVRERQPGQARDVFGDRINQLDLRMSKILRFARVRTQIAVDLYNALNANPIETYNQAFIANGAWLTPTGILTARFAKITAQLDF